MCFCAILKPIIKTLLHVFQRYGYGGFVQLHHHCKVSFYCYYFVLFLCACIDRVQEEPLCNRTAYNARDTAGSTLWTFQVLDMWAAAELSTVPLRQRKDSLQIPPQHSRAQSSLAAAVMQLLVADIGWAFGISKLHIRTFYCIQT